MGMRHTRKVFAALFVQLLICLCVGALVFAAGSTWAFADENASVGEAASQENSKEDASQSSDDEELTGDELEESLNDLGDGNLVDIQQTPDNSFLYDSDIYDLNNADVSYQETTVQVKGEVVGNAIRAEQNAGKYWITLNSLPDEEEGSISVLIDKDSLGLIDSYGSYNKKGTTIEVNGTFYVSCTSHEGIMDIHASTVKLVEKGSLQRDAFNPNDFLPGILLCAAGVVLFVLYRILAEGER